MIVILHADMCLFPNLVDILENVFVEGPSSIAPVEPFYKSVLGRFPRLDIFKFYSVYLAPIVR